MQLTDFHQAPPARLLVALLIIGQLASCGFATYQAKPVDAAANIAVFKQKNPNSAEFYEFLTRNGHAVSTPISMWDLPTLIDCALFFNPSLDVARAQLKLAETSTAIAAQHPLPNLNTTISNSDQANGDISPFGLGLSIDIPIETANKRDTRIENATHLSQITKLKIAQSAWQLSHQVTLTYYAIQYNHALITLLSAEEALRKEIVAIYLKRADVGMASNVELSLANLQLQTASAALNAEQQQTAVLRARLAGDLGLPLNIVHTMNIKTDDPILLEVNTDDAEKIALFNRLDIRIALEQYAIAETKLKLEIAKQYPDLAISPGYAYEFGDRVWSLGITSLLALLNKNKAAINEATQLREVEATNFMLLQAEVMNETNLAATQLHKAQQIIAHQKDLRDAQQRSVKSMQARFKAGDIDRLEFTYSQLENILADKNVALASHDLNIAASQLENALQRPLDENVSVENR